MSPRDQLLTGGASYSVPAIFRRGHEEAEEVLDLINALLEPAGWEARLDCPERQRMFSATICTFRVQRRPSSSA